MVFFLRAKKVSLMELNEVSNPYPTELRRYMSSTLSSVSSALNVSVSPACATAVFHWPSLREMSVT